MNDRMGEVRLPFDPADSHDGSLTFIGNLRSPWSPGGAPKNLRQARESGHSDFWIELKPHYRSGLIGLAVGQAIWVILWFDRSRRDLIIQSPRHADAPRGTFSLRSPVRPNPIAIEAVIITSLDTETGVIGIDTTDAFDNTPVLDIKPWLQSVDIPPISG